MSGAISERGLVCAAKQGGTAKGGRLSSTVSRRRFPKQASSKPGVGLLVLRLSQGAARKQCPRLGRGSRGSGRSEESSAWRGSLLAKNTTTQWILLSGLILLGGSEQSCRLPSKQTTGLLLLLLLRLGSTEDLGQ